MMTHIREFALEAETRNDFLTLESAIIHYFCRNVSF